jgi:predicted transport protein
LELVNAVTAQPGSGGTTTTGSGYKSVEMQLAGASVEVVAMFEAVKETLLSFGDDIQIKTLKFYFAFKRIKNFCCVEVRTQKKEVLIYVKVNPDKVTLEKGFTRDVRKIGHFGTGDLEITLGSLEDLEKAKPLLKGKNSTAPRQGIILFCISAALLAFSLIWQTRPTTHNSRAGQENCRVSFQDSECIDLDSYCPECERAADHNFPPSMRFFPQRSAKSVFAMRRCIALRPSNW